MNAGKQATWFFLTLMGLAISGWYFAASDSLQPVDEKALTHTVDTIITDLTVREFNDQGQLANAIKSARVKHIPHGDKHWFNSPVILVSHDDNIPWKITAKEATSFNGGAQIVLNQNVVIHQNSSSNHPESTLTTDKLTYFPDKKIALSDNHVMFKQPGSIVQSKGMKAWLAQKRVKLLGKARGQYDPKHG